MRSIRVLSWGLVAFAVVFASCASRAVSDPEEGGSRNLITRAELSGSNDRNVFEAVRRLRPSWLRYRGQSVLTGPDREGLRVYLNGAFFGDAQALGSLQVTDVGEVRFLDAREATLRFGTGHTVGAIMVATLKGVPPLEGASGFPD